MSLNTSAISVPSRHSLLRSNNLSNSDRSSLASSRPMGILDEPDINPYKDQFKQTLNNKVTHIETDIVSTQKKMRVLKIVFVALLTLGIICAASFILLPALGAIAGVLGLSLAVTMIAWESLFLGGGLIAGLSFIPRKLFLNQVENRDLLLEKKVFFAKSNDEQTEFENFLRYELINAQFNDRDLIVSSLDFADLYYIVLDKNEKESRLNELRSLYIETKNSTKVSSTHWNHKRQLKKVKKEIKTMEREVQNLTNEIVEIRHKLKEL